MDVNAKVKVRLLPELFWLHPNSLTPGSKHLHTRGAMLGSWAVFKAHLCLSSLPGQLSLNAFEGFQVLETKENEKPSSLDLKAEGQLGKRCCKMRLNEDK